MGMEELVIVVLADIFAIKGLPIWVPRRLSIIVKDTGESDVEFFIQEINIDQEILENNNCSVFFLTSKELIKASFGLRNICIERRKRSDIVAIQKQLKVPIKDKFTDPDIEYYSVHLIFSNGSDDTIFEPEFITELNLKNYKRLVSKI